MRARFEKIPLDTGSNVLLDTGSVLTEDGISRLLTEGSDVLNTERGALFKLNGWARDSAGKPYVTTNTPSSPTMMEGIAFDADGAMHVTYAVPSIPTMLEGVAISLLGQVHLFDGVSGNLTDEAGSELLTEGGDYLILEAAAVGNFAGIPLTALGQLFFD